MAEKKTGIPDKAIPVTTFQRLHGIVQEFVEGRIGLLVLLGPSGLGKSETFQKAIGDNDHLFIGGHCTALAFHMDVYRKIHQPIIIDDIEGFFLADKQKREQVKALTDTKVRKKMTFSSTTKKLEDVPQVFETTS